MDIFITILAYIFGAFLLLGAVGLVFVTLQLIVYALKGKLFTGDLPWWAFWSSIHKD